MGIQPSYEQHSIAPENLAAVRRRDFLVTSAGSREAAATAFAYPDLVTRTKPEVVPVTESVDAPAYDASNPATEQLARAERALAEALKERP